jgi:pimeloyl-ACP methyl ester carboxylesterase
MPAPLRRPRSAVFAFPADPLEAVTSDGVRLAVSRLGDARPAVVLCHGFTGWRTKPRYARFAEALSRWFTVYTFDLRGHGESEGVSTLGGSEIHDVAAIVDLARAEGHERVGTVGASMGGVAAVRHAALIGGVDGVVSISTPARWDGHHSEALRRMQWLTSTAQGRRVARLVGVRLPDRWDRPETPEDVAGRIAPVPLLVVHGRDDHFFDEEEAWRLYRAAGQPKRMLLADRFGHAEDGFSSDLAERIARFLLGAWELPWPA